MLAEVSDADQLNLFIPLEVIDEEGKVLSTREVPMKVNPDSPEVVKAKHEAWMKAHPPSDGEVLRAFIEQAWRRKHGMLP